jgi:hypothetical protein
LYAALTFKPGFSGAKNIYMFAANAGGTSSGWQTRGTWTVPGGIVVTADAVSPNAGTGASQNFVLHYSDTAGATDLANAWVWFNATFASSAANSCLVYYDRAAGTVNLLNDAGTTWMAGTVGSGGTLQNAQCAMALDGTTTATLGGSALTLTLSMTFKPGFSGTKDILVDEPGA